MSWSHLASQSSSLMSGCRFPLRIANLPFPFTRRKPSAKRCCLPISASENHLTDTRHCWETECPFVEVEESSSYRPGVILLGAPSSWKSFIECSPHCPVWRCLFAGSIHLHLSQTSCYVCSSVVGLRCLLCSRSLSDVCMGSHKQ